MQHLSQQSLLVATLALFCIVQFSHQFAASGTSAQLQAQKTGNKTTGICGSTNQLATKIERCARPVLDLLEGTVVNWPKSEADSRRLCDDIIAGERCMKDEGRRCAKGLHKTIVSTLATSITRSRKVECPKLGEVLQTTKCIEKHSARSQAVIANVNNRLSVVETQMKDLDEKTNAICCVTKEFEKELKSLIKSICPVDGDMILRLYRGVTEDVLNLICRNPRCNKVFEGYKIPKPSLKAYGGIVEILLRIIFSLEGTH